MLIPLPSGTVSPTPVMFNSRLPEFNRLLSFFLKNKKGKPRLIHGFPVKTILEPIHYGCQAPFFLNLDNKFFNVFFYPPFFRTRSRPYPRRACEK
jgi:hypothetical protein